MNYRWLDTPICSLLLTSDGRSLTGLYLQGQKHFPNQTPDWKESTELALFIKAENQLKEYFAHQRQQFDLPLDPVGTPFQKQVWKELSKIPFGETITYGTLANRIGIPTAYRAVGAANGRNPISIVVPCHRVIATNGKMTGYAGGVDRKQWLLKHEQASINSHPMQHPLIEQATEL
ncbi:methylated-DNA--[protein]-cysteine S-methyltransferase [Leptolyngbya sp. AN03gr2]|uniref:methylated-DNA--[protein]-cysteine S-methyltransferase n=1 Tax=unclassified Leptolyngbya TaxID=2650499 RepID=UPI003D31B6D1